MGTDMGRTFSAGMIRGFSVDSFFINRRIQEVISKHQCGRKGGREIRERKALQLM